MTHGTVLGPLQHLVERLDEVKQGYRQAGIGVFGGERLDLRIGPDIFLDQPLLLKHFGGVLEAFVFEKPVDQFLPGIFCVFAVPLESRVAGQEHFGFNMNQCRRHVDKFSAQIHVHLAGLLHVRQVLGSDGRDGDVLDVDLLFADEIEQQIEGAFVVLQVDVEGR